jgi:hypothetical protein
VSRAGRPQCQHVTDSFNMSEVLMALMLPEDTQFALPHPTMSDMNDTIQKLESY